jgi:hypothetical protein
MLRSEDAWPMIVNALLVLFGVPMALWLYFEYPDAVRDPWTWLETRPFALQVAGLFAIQPLLILVARGLLWGLDRVLELMSRPRGPFVVEREGSPGSWQAMATTDTLQRAKDLAHDGHRRVRDRHGVVVHHGQLLSEGQP